MLAPADTDPLLAQWHPASLASILPRMSSIVITSASATSSSSSSASSTTSTGPRKRRREVFIVRRPPCVFITCICISWCVCSASTRHGQACPGNLHARSV